VSPFRAFHRWAVRFGIARGFKIQPPPGWIPATSRLNPFPEWRSPDDRAHIRVLTLKAGSCQNLADFERVWPGNPPYDRHSEEHLANGTQVIRREKSERDVRSGVAYEWMDVLAIIDTVPILFTLRVLPPIEPALIEAFHTMITTYITDY
jgi:hypothetical protein